jgi:G3E family GTPase
MGGDLAAALPDAAGLVLDRQAPIPVAVLTGFLGSGKTTLIRGLLRDPCFAETAVVVNEIGEIGLDHLLLESAREDVLLLEGGCLCCAAHGDLVRALRALLDRSERGELPVFRRVVVETSGLADPAPVLLSLMSDPLRLSRFKPAGLTVTADCVLGIETLARHDEAIRQVVLADRILLTKTDLVDAQRRQVTIDALRRHSQAPILPVSAESAGPILFRPAIRDIDWPGLAMPHRHGAYVTASRRIERPLAWPRVDSWLRATVETLGPRLLRLKALLAIEGEDRPVALHAVQHMIHLPERLTAWPDGQRRGRIVMIAESVEPGLLHAMLEELGTGKGPVYLSGASLPSA